MSETNHLKRGACGRDNLDRWGFTKNMYRGEQRTQKGCYSQGVDQQNIQENSILYYVKYMK
jgi:hypothetical protein